MSDVWNTISSVARTIMPKQYIPSNVFSLIIEYHTGEIERVLFQLPPESITESKGANFASDHVLGRFEPIRMYTNSEATRINFTVNYYWMEDSLLNNSVGTWNGIRDNVLKLRALLYPYDSGRASAGGGSGGGGLGNAIGGMFGGGVLSNVVSGAVNTMLPQTANVGSSSPETNAFDQYVGRLSPPPGIKLYYGDLYQGLPCLLAGIQMEFKGPWNDASLASVARRLAQSTSTSFSTGLTKALNTANQVLTPVLGIVNSLPSNVLGNKTGLLNSLVNALRQDKLFPFQTTVNISLETMYPYATQKTYNDIRKAGVYGSSSSPMLSKIVSNLPIIGGIFR
jgi:hypothetical protein